MENEEKDTAIQESEKQKRKLSELDGRRQILYLAAGVYLIYLAGKILKELSGDTVQNRVILIAAAAAFILFGGLLAVRAIYAFIMQQKKTDQTDQKDEDEE